MKPIVLIHGYSSEGKDAPAEAIYGTLPADLREVFGPENVLDINLGRWISLNDGVALDDVSFALERALHSEQFGPLLATGFHVVVHSTGALVVRNWLRQYSPRPSPIGNLVHLAGANFGSGLAHIARGTLVRWWREIFQGVEAGVRVLEELEFGAHKTLDLHLHFLKPGSLMDADYGVQEYCAIGSQTLKALRLVPVRYVKEDSSDSTVRTSSCNLNFNYLAIRPRPEASALPFSEVRSANELRLDNQRVPADWYEFATVSLAADRPPVPFAVLYETVHFGGDMGIVNGTSTRTQVLPLLKQALTAADPGEDRERVAADWDKVTNLTLQRVARLKNTLTDWNRREQYEGHSQLIFRLRDQFGRDVDHHDITFRSGGTKGSEPLEWMIEDKRDNAHHPGTTTYYLRTQKFQKENGKQVLRNRLDAVAPLDFEITGYEPGIGEIVYLPLRVRLTSAKVRQFIQPFRTTFIDVTLLRLPAPNVFELTKAPLA